MCWFFFKKTSKNRGIQRPPFCYLLFYLLILNKHSFFTGFPACIPEWGSLYPSRSTASDGINWKRATSQRTS